MKQGNIIDNQGREGVSPFFGGGGWGYAFPHLDRFITSCIVSDLMRDPVVPLF